MTVHAVNAVDGEYSFFGRFHEVTPHARIIRNFEFLGYRMSVYALGKLLGDDEDIRSVVAFYTHIFADSRMLTPAAGARACAAGSRIRSVSVGIVPGRFFESMASKDPKAVARVSASLMTMKKTVMAELESAANG